MNTDEELAQARAIFKNEHESLSKEIAIVILKNAKSVSLKLKVIALFKHLFR